MLIWMAACSRLLAAQQATAPPPTTLESTLQRLGEQAVLLQRSLPSLTCMESVVSQEFRHKMVVRSVDFTASLRAVRDGDGEIRESYEFKTVRGQPFTTGGFVMPTYVTGGFSRALRYFSPDQQPCYRYTLKGSRIDFETAPQTPEACRTRGTSGFALLDGQGNITHLERRVATRYSEEYHQVPFAALDLTPLTLNGVTYLMTRHLFAEQPEGGATDRFEADYTDCKLFTATVTIGPAVETPDTTAPPK
jgi:hypothetical protein